ncbi:MAG: alanine racemase [Sphingobacteriaceae bacterium]|nr:alanine racemase [Sphingobacteriaceae bacterium]
MNQAPFSTSCIQISTAAIRSNIHFLRKTMGNKVCLSSVVKGNAYGHGISTYVPLAEAAGVTHFSVFSDEEAWQVKAVCRPSTEVMIMGQVSDSGLDWAIKNDVSFFVFDFARLDKTIARARFLGKAARIHLEIETGMNRTGFQLTALPTLLALLKQNKTHLVLEGLCTHYAGAESITNFVRVKQQIEQFKLAQAQFKQARLKVRRHHTACSAAALMYPETRMDMVRIGILQYGFWPSPEVKLRFLGPLEGAKTKADPLKRCMRWTSEVMSVQEVAAGEFIGYGTHYLAQKKMRVATVPVGYSHGYARSLSNQGRVLIGSHEAAVIGVVNMSLMLVDVTAHKHIQIGDEVVLIGKNGKKAITVASFGELSHQLNYELLTRMPLNIARKPVA